MKEPLHHDRRQRGATLIIALVMLLLVTLVGIAMVRASTMDEKMAGNFRDRDQAFQAGEAAVRTCLAQVEGGTYTGIAPLLTPAAAGSLPNWEQDWSPANSAVVDVGNPHLANQPSCMVETMGGVGTPS